MTSKTRVHRSKSQFVTLKPFGSRNLRPPILRGFFGFLSMTFYDMYIIYLSAAEALWKKTRSAARYSRGSRAGEGSPSLKPLPGLPPPPPLGAPPLKP